MVPLFDLEDVFLSYRGTAHGENVLRGVNLKIFPKDFVALKGPSGSGKSSLLYILGLLLAPTKGQMRFKGERIEKLADTKLAFIRNRNIGFVFQQFHLIPKATVLDNILLPSKYPSEYLSDQTAARTKALQLAKRLGLDHVLKHKPNQLSGGQQQRVAIARALINGPDIILADEPTGNLDTKNTAEILSIFKELHAEGKTIIIITHEDEVAAQCESIIEIRDGLVQTPASPARPKSEEGGIVARPERRNPLGLWLSLLPDAVSNLKRNKFRSFLTMLGVVIGIASVLSMTTLGDFAKKRILQGYELMGVNRLSIWGHKNWDAKAIDDVKVIFQGFDVKNELVRIEELFNDIELISPVLFSNERNAVFSGALMDSVAVMGVAPTYFHITNWPMDIGTSFTNYHVDTQSPVCVIGHDIAQQLFRQVSPLGQVIQMADDNTSFGCRILGVLSLKSSSSEEDERLNKQIFLPYSYHKIVASNWWDSGINNILIKVKSGADVEKTGNRIKGFFERKYGKGGHFRVGREDVMIFQVKRALNIFSILLASIAGISLVVGGIGIANMMMVALAERYREIGLRKALGATHSSLKRQFLLESIMLCFFAGVIGIMFGFGIYEGILYAASKFFDKLQFEWMWNPVAVVMAFGCIIAVGIISGLAPAIKAEKLQVIEALRSE
ncbi:MAG: ABC transporter permease [Oligoflexales bacterium]